MIAIPDVLSITCHYNNETNNNEDEETYND